VGEFYSRSSLPAPPQPRLELANGTGRRPGFIVSLVAYRPLPILKDRRPESESE